MKKTLIMICLGGMILFSGCVAPSDQYRLLENRITAIEIETYNQTSGQNAKSGKGSQTPENLDLLEKKFEEKSRIDRENTAQIKYEIQQIKEKFQHMEGSIEEITHNLGTKGQARQQDVEKRLERLDNAISRNYEKILVLEKHMGFEPVAAGQADEAPTETRSLAQPKPATPQISPKPEKIETGSEQESYELAKKLHDEGDRENARIQFENFINKYPKSKNAGSARFWIADSYFMEKWYEKAILEYQKVLENYPDSNKTAAARLKQGYSFAELGEKANARLILNELIKRHPDSNEAKYAQEKLKSLN